MPIKVKKEIQLMVFLTIFFLLIMPVSGRCIINLELEHGNKTEYLFIYVDDDNILGPWDGTIDNPFRYIQDAINLTVERETIFVFNGTYKEDVFINKSISLLGENKNSTIIDGCKKESVIYVLEDFVSISNFTIKNSGNTFWVDSGIYVLSNNSYIRNNIFLNDTDGGVFLSDSKSNIITDNIFKNNDGAGVFVKDSSNNVVKNNVMVNNSLAGVYLDHSNLNNISNNFISDSNYGVHLYYSNHNNILQNIITAVKYSECGLNLIASHNNNVFKNKIIGNDCCGIFFELSSHNKISYNEIKENNQGVYLMHFSNKNEISYNNFINNYQRCAFFRNSFFNKWNDNYWDEWKGLEYQYSKLPMIIPGRILICRFRCNLDWNPAKEPYNI